MSLWDTVRRMFDPGKDSLRALKARRGEMRDALWQLLAHKLPAPLSDTDALREGLRDIHLADPTALPYLLEIIGAVYKEVRDD